MGIIERIRATLRDPLYRHECRDLDRSIISATSSPFWATFVSCLLIFCATIGWSVYRAVDKSMFFLLIGLAMPPLSLYAAAIDGNSSWIREIRRETLQSLLLTTKSREQMLWAKALAAVRPYLCAAPLLLLVGPLAGLFLAVVRPEAGAATCWILAGAGFLVGGALCLLMIGSTLCSVALGTYAALRLRGGLVRRILSMLLVLPFIFADILVIGVPTGVVLLALPGKGAIIAPNIVGSAEIARFSIFIAAAILARLALDVWLSVKLMRHSARRMDELLLRD